MIKKAAILTASLALVPVAGIAQTGTAAYALPGEGDGELTLSGTGSSDRNFDAGNFGISGDIGWYTNPQFMWGVRQSINYASIPGAGLRDDFWNGATRGFINHHFGTTNARPFLGGSLGMIYGDGVRDTGFAGLEAGLKFYVADRTFVLARAEYQWLFERARDIDNTFDRGGWAYTLGIGFNY